MSVKQEREYTLELRYLDSFEMVILEALFQKHNIQYSGKKNLDDYLKLMGLSRGSTEVITNFEALPLVEGGLLKVQEEYRGIIHILHTSKYETGKQFTQDYYNRNKENFMNPEWLKAHSHIIYKGKDCFFIRDLLHSLNGEAWYKIDDKNLCG